MTGTIRPFSMAIAMPTLTRRLRRARRRCSGRSGPGCREALRPTALTTKGRKAQPDSLSSSVCVGVGGAQLDYRRHVGFERAVGHRHRGRTGHLGGNPAAHLVVGDENFVLAGFPGDGRRWRRDGRCQARRMTRDARRGCPKEPTERLRPGSARVAAHAPWRVPREWRHRAPWPTRREWRRPSAAAPRSDDVFTRDPARHDPFLRSGPATGRAGASAANGRGHPCVPVANRDYRSDLGLRGPRLAHDRSSLRRLDGRGTRRPKPRPGSLRRHRPSRRRQCPSPRLESLGPSRQLPRSPRSRR